MSSKKNKNKTITQVAPAVQMAQPPRQVVYVVPSVSPFFFVAAQAVNFFQQQPQQYIMSQQIVQQNGVTYVQNIATPVQVVYNVPTVQVVRPVYVMQPNMVMVPMAQQQQPVQMAQRPMQMAQPVQMAQPPVQMAQPPAAQASRQPVQMAQKPAAAVATQAAAAAPQAAAVPLAHRNSISEPETVQFARTGRKQSNRTVEQVPNLYPTAVAESRAAAKPAPLQHSPSAPAMTMVDKEFDAIKNRDIPANANYGSITLSLNSAPPPLPQDLARPQSIYGVAPAARDTATYDAVPSDHYARAPSPATVELDDEVSFPSAPTAAPVAPRSANANKSKVSISQQAMYI